MVDPISTACGWRCRTKARPLMKPHAARAIGEVILEMPNAADRAGYWLYFDDDSNPQVGTPTATEMTVSAFMETVLDDGSAAAARLTLYPASRLQLAAHRLHSR